MSHLISIVFILIFVFAPTSLLTSVSQAYDSVPVENGGEISGIIKLKGEVPIIAPHKVIHNPEFCGDLVPDETFVINPSNRGLQNVAVSIDGISRGKGHQPLTLLINNFKCRFQPHLQAGMIGDFYEIKNSDPILHNSHFKMEDVTVLNVAMPPSGKSIRKPLTQAGTITMKCDAHTFMTGTILAFEHPYFTVTDQDGAYKISDIPPGKYHVRFWSEGTGSKEKEITIGPGEKVKLSIELSAK